MKKIELENGHYMIINHLYKEETKIDHEFYYNSNGNRHRLNGPARIFYYRSGEIESEIYYINGKKHRLNGPAEIWYHKSGEIEFEDYFVNGKEYLKEEFYKRPEVIKFRNINRNLKLLNKK